MKFLARAVQILAVAVGCSIGWASPARATPLVIDAGSDLFVTIPGSPSGTDPGTYDQIALPPGFFGTIMGQPSDAFTDTIYLAGEATGPLGNPLPLFHPYPEINEAAATARHLVRDPRDAGGGGGGLGDVDTIVHRDDSVTLPMNGSMGTTGLQIQSLGLQSVIPVPVTYGGGAFNALFDLFVDLDPTITQPQGTMTLTRTSDIGGTFDSFLPVIPRLTFVVDPASPLPVLNPPGPVDSPFEIDFTLTGTNFSVPEPATVALFGLGLIALCGHARGRNRGEGISGAATDHCNEQVSQE